MPQLYFIGDSNTGKSHIIHSLINPTEQYNPIITIGLCLKKYTIENKTIQIWDCSGYKMFYPFIRDFIRMAPFVCIVCNIHCQSSVFSLIYHRSNIKHIPYYILINTYSPNSDTEPNIILKLTEYMNKFYPDRYSFINSNNPNKVMNKILKKYIV